MNDIIFMCDQCRDQTNFGGKVPKGVRYPFPVLNHREMFGRG